MIMVPAIQLLQQLFRNLALNLFVQTCYSAKGIGDSSGVVLQRLSKRDGLTELFF